MSIKQTQDWMERLVKNYKLPEENPKQKKEPVKLLKESQLKIIMNRDKPNNIKK
jgi:hypothetical protein